MSSHETPRVCISGHLVHLAPHAQRRNVCLRHALAISAHDCMGVVQGVETSPVWGPPGPVFGNFENGGNGGFVFS